MTGNLYLFELYSQKAGNGRYLCIANSEDEAWQIFKQDVAPQKIIENHKHEYGEGHYLVDANENEPNLDHGQPRQCHQVFLRQMFLQTIEWD